MVAALAGRRNRSLVFTRTKHGAHKLARQLTAARIPAAELHGNLTQGARERNLASFASGAVRVMVATDIAARGIHVDGIDLVIHADPPAEHKAYLHRSGRTARAGAAGVVVTLQTPAQAGDVRALMRKARVVPLAATVTPAPRCCARSPVTPFRRCSGQRAPSTRWPPHPSRPPVAAPQRCPPVSAAGAGDAPWLTAPAPGASSLGARSTSRRRRASRRGVRRCGPGDPRPVRPRPGRGP